MFNAKEIDENTFVLLCSKKERDNLGLIVTESIKLYKYTDMIYRNVSLKNVMEVADIFSKHRSGEVPLNRLNLKTLIVLVQETGIKIIPNLEVSIKEKIMAQFNNFQNWDAYAEYHYNNDDCLDSTFDE